MRRALFATALFSLFKLAEAARTTAPSRHTKHEKNSEYEAKTRDAIEFYAGKYLNAPQFDLNSRRVAIALVERIKQLPPVKFVESRNISTTQTPNYGPLASAVGTLAEQFKDRTLYARLPFRVSEILVSTAFTLLNLCNNPAFAEALNAQITAERRANPEVEGVLEQVKNCLNWFRANCQDLQSPLYGISTDTIGGNQQRVASYLLDSAYGFGQVVNATVNAASQNAASKPKP